MFNNIENFYSANRAILLDDKSSGSIRPGKSITKDSESTISKFVKYYTSNNNNINLTDNDVDNILGLGQTNTRVQNIRLMKEFRFLIETQQNSTNANAKTYVLTNDFGQFVASGKTKDDYVLDMLYNIRDINDFTMYLNFLICTLREAYLYGEIILFPDSIDKFRSSVVKQQERIVLRQRILDVYGYSGRNDTPENDTYSPNLTYMSHGELERLGFIVQIKKSSTDSLNKCVLTTKGYKYLEHLDIVLGKTIKKGNCNIMSLNYKTNLAIEKKRNIIFFGAPGTGKSHCLNLEKDTLLNKFNCPNNYERVTFHPDYSYAHFVGTYKPVMVTNVQGEDEISYEFVPGPFIRLLVEAIKNANTSTHLPYVLLIEEINRANVAAVFGDVFQLLDRDKDGVSEYEISPSNDLKRYLAKELGVSSDLVNTIRIPNNLFIWSTMNSADQGVFPMDTAFKRRWDFKYLGIDDAVSKMDSTILNRKFEFGEGRYKTEITWNDIRVAINNELSSDEYNINEDKQLGPYFISKNVLETSTNEEFLNVFKNKVLMYLFEDAVKQKKNSFFINCHEKSRNSRYSEICRIFDKKGVYIFPDSISSLFKTVTSQISGSTTQNINQFQTSDTDKDDD